jgi:signal transduction histidine kinase/PAS domain-containing protein
MRLNVRVGMKSAREKTHLSGRVCNLLYAQRIISLFSGCFFFTYETFERFQRIEEMGKSSQYVTQSKKRPGVTPARKHAPRSTPLKIRYNESTPCNQLESIFELLPDSVIACDQEGKIIWINAAAHKLFEVPSEARLQGTSYQQFLEDFELYDEDEQHQSISPEPWLMNLVTDDKAASRAPEKTLMLHLPSGGKVYTNLRCLPWFDSQKRAVGAVFVFHSITHSYQKALHLQRVHQAVLALTDAIAHIPEHFDPAPPEETPLLSPPVSFVAQQLVNVIRQVLDCRRVSLITYGPEDHQYYVAGSGLTAEQKEYWQQVKGRLLPSVFVNETVFARLSANQEIILAGDDLYRPPQFHAEFGTENLLLVPLFLEQRLAGTLVIVKADSNSGYTPEEVELVKAVAAQSVLIIECLLCLHEEVQTQTRALVQQEIHRLSNDFLTLASHELLTPLTVIIGNIQLAHRRLEALKRQVIEEPGRVSEKIEHAQHPLASASQSAGLQKRMINDIIDDARIQTKQLNLRMSHCDLLTLLREAVTKQQQSMPERTIVLKLPPTEQGVPIFADAERITQVLNAYLANALKYSPIEQPVTVQLVVADSAAIVSVRDEGPGIPAEEQELLWERFYRAKGSTVQQELDLSLGLGLYLCRALIEYHHGRVGVQSDPGHGETFWFTLPVVAPPAG